jgi:hypothetical protein
MICRSTIGGLLCSCLVCFATCKYLNPINIMEMASTTISPGPMVMNLRFDCLLILDVLFIILPVQRQKDRDQDRTFSRSFMMNITS